MHIFTHGAKSVTLTHQRPDEGDIRLRDMSKYPDYIFFFPPKISLPLSSSGKYYRAKSARLSASGESVKNPNLTPLKKNKKTGEEVVWFLFRRGSDSSGGNLGPTVRAALGVCDKACEAFSPSVSSQSSSSTSLCCTTPAVSPGQPPPIGQVRDTTPLHAEGVFGFFCTQVVCEKFCDEPDCDRLCLCLLASVGRG